MNELDASKVMAFALDKIFKQPAKPRPKRPDFEGIVASYILEHFEKNTLLSIEDMLDTAFQQKDLLDDLAERVFDCLDIVEIHNKVDAEWNQ